MTQRLIRRFIQHSTQTQDPQVREQYGRLSGVVGIILNLLLSAGKLLAGLAASSIAIMADAFNSLSDAGSSVVTLVGFRLAGRRADAEHPFGHGRKEYLAGLLVALIILLVGVELGKSSVEKIFHPTSVHFSRLSAAVLAVSIAVKLWMGRFNRTLARRIDSAAIAATAADSLSDAAATSAVLLGMVVDHLTGFPIDGWLGVLMALLILRAGWDAAKDTLNPLLGQRPDPTLIQAIRQNVLSHPQIMGMHDLILHDYGPGRRMMSFHAEVPMDADFMEMHDLIDHIERELKLTYQIDTSIHLDPIAVNDQRTDTLRAETVALVREIHPDLTIHDFRITSGPDHTNLIFDVLAPHSVTLSDEVLKAAVIQALSEKNPRYYGVVQIDRLME
ncbi:MAG: cation transporter [Oscillospiraceae bacterium]|nr:cation transporter [Oscillospiraceae bacterium]